MPDMVVVTEPVVLLDETGSKSTVDRNCSCPQHTQTPAGHPPLRVTVISRPFYFHRHCLLRCGLPAVCQCLTSPPQPPPPPSRPLCRQLCPHSLSLSPASPRPPPSFSFLRLTLSKKVVRITSEGICHGRERHEGGKEGQGNQGSRGA